MYRVDSTMGRGGWAHGPVFASLALAELYARRCARPTRVVNTIAEGLLAMRETRGYDSDDHDRAAACITADLLVPPASPRP